MSATFQPFGLKPAYHPSGLDRSVPFVGTNTYVPGTTYTAPYNLSAGQSFWQYQPVSITTVTGALTIAPQSAASGGVYGSFDGVEYTSAEGRRSVAKYAAKTTLDAATNIIFWIFQDPALVYEIQVNGPANANVIGAEYNFDTTTGSRTVDGYAIGNGGAGFSTTALLATPVTAGTGQGQVRVVGLGREVAYPAGNTNQWGDAYTIVQVVIANNQFAAPSTSV
jgi:hypothetical protein